VVLEHTISVKDLVYFSCSQGDLDSRYLPSPSAEQGLRGHQQLQRERPASYQAECPLSGDYTEGEARLTVRGRADGVDLSGRLVEEIKTCRIDPALLPENQQALHWAQLKIYGHLLLQQQPWDRIQLRLCYLELSPQRQHLHSREFERQSLAAFFDDSCRAYLHWLRQLGRWRAERDASIRALSFPFGSFRPGQRPLSVAVYRTLEQGRHLLVEAPTGIGKTMATLFPAIKAIAQGHLEHWCYLTAKNIARQVAEEGLARLRDAGLQFRALTLTGREQICFSPGQACEPRACPYACGFYDKLPVARSALLERQALTQPAIEQVAREQQLCPYYLAMHFAPWADALICDYNYAFDPVNSFRWLMAEQRSRFALLIDEGHNLPGRARLLYSAAIRREPLRRLASSEPKPIATALNRLSRQLLTLRKELTEAGQTERFDTALPESVIGAAARLLQAVDSWRAEQPQDELAAALLEVYFDCFRLVQVAELFGSDFCCHLQRPGGRELRLSLECLDPARLLALRYRQACACVLFSATLAPLDFSRRVCGLSEDSWVLQLPSPFPPERQGVFMVSGVDTRYRARQHSYQKIASLIETTYRSRPGNYLVFFPSFGYLQEVAQLLPERLPLLIQQRDLDPAGRQAFISRFFEESGPGTIGLAVAGGVFSEGIDLPGKRLIGVMVIGVGLPQVNGLNQRLRDYYQQRFGRGFEFAYQYPGMQKVVQAVGRLIRDDRDYGVVVLVDSRYPSPGYRCLLPSWWQMETVLPSHLAKRLQVFWARRGD